MYNTYLIQVVLVGESAPAARAPIIPPVIESIHMLVRIILGVELCIASLAVDLVRPVIPLIHVVIDIFLRVELFNAHVAFPMADCAHVLTSSLPVNECAPARGCCAVDHRDRRRRRKPQPSVNPCVEVAVEGGNSLSLHNATALTRNRRLSDINVSFGLSQYCLVSPDVSLLREVLIVSAVFLEAA